MIFEVEGIENGVMPILPKEVGSVPFNVEIVVVGCWWFGLN